MAALAVLIAACDSTRPVEETSQTFECERCHGYPPAPPHPTLAECSTCHPATVEADNVTLVPGGPHMNGVADAIQNHPVPYPAHPTDALAAIGSCTACHGDDYGGGGAADSCNACHAPLVGGDDWKTNCTFCHGTRTAGVTSATAAAAPPASVEGGGTQDNTNPDVGAHQAHLGSQLSASIACDSCHTVPTAATALSHFSGRTAPATVTFDALATQGAAGATYTGGSCAVYCHGNGTSWPAGSVGADKTPQWTQAAVACNACHASRPATGAHTSIGPHNAAPCTFCHLDYVQNTTVDPALHVNGTRNVRFINKTGQPVDYTEGWSCTACHNVNGNF